MHSRHTHSGQGCDANTVTPDEATDTPVVFSDGIPNGVLLSRLADPRNVPRQWRHPTLMDGWRDAMRKEMENLQSHGVYELVPCGEHSASVGSSIANSKTVPPTRTRHD